MEILRVEHLEGLQRQIDWLAAQLEELRTQEYNMAQNHGWYNAAWRKDPIRFGYSGPIRELVDNTALAAGNNTINGATVPAGEIWVITNWSIYYTGTVAGVAIYAMIVSGGTPYSQFEQAPPVSALVYDRQGWWILDPGENARLFVTGATLNDDAGFRITGFRVDIDQ